MNFSLNDVLEPHKNNLFLARTSAQRISLAIPAEAKATSETELPLREIYYRQATFLKELQKY